jgi:hypothetical protein
MVSFSKEMQMSIPQKLAALTGRWQGTNQLWLDPSQPSTDSDSVLEISLTALGKFASFQYTWAYEGQAQAGLLIVGSESEAAQAVWMDSWHMQDKFMVCEGEMQPTGAFSVKGTYAALPGPDWGWRIAVEPQDSGVLKFTMFNIAPDNQEFLAVETIFRRTS